MLTLNNLRKYVFFYLHHSLVIFLPDFATRVCVLLNLMSLLLGVVGSKYSVLIFHMHSSNDDIITTVLIMQ